MTDSWIAPWADRLPFTPGSLALEWALLLALATLVGHLVQRFTHLRRLQPVAHQHGNIRSLHRARGFPTPQQRAPLLTGA